MVEIESSIDPVTESSSIHGATSSDALENSEEKENEELPMVVWLKGDESYVDEFCLDAEAAMKEIGIRRSRLTQISGKELRVGRMRIDRYVRPVYRKKDIDEYKKWTRATASHLRSSSVLEQASKKLENKVSEIESNLEDRVKDIHQDLQEQISAFSLKLDEHKESVASALSLSMTEKLEGLAKSILSIEASLFEQMDSFKESLRPLTPDDLDVAFAAVKDPLNEIRNYQSEINQVTTDISTLLSPMEDIRDHLVNDLQEIGPSLGELYTLVYDSSASTKESLEGQNRFNRKMAEMLSKVIEFQRDALMKQQAMLVRLGKAINLNGEVVTPVKQNRRKNLSAIRRRRLKLK